MRFRILLRTAKFIAFYWSLPFLLGCTLTVILIATGEYLLLDDLTKAFDEVIAKCAL